MLATSHHLRRVGLRPLACGVGLVIAARSVQGLGMLEELTVIGVTAEGVVTRIATLARGGLVRMPGARFIIELPLHCKAPQPGDRLVYTRTRRPVRSSDPPKVGP